MGPCMVSIFQYTLISEKMQRYTVYLYMETTVYVLGGTSTHHQERIQLYAVGGVSHPQHTQTGSNSSTKAADSSNGVTNTRCCRYSCIHSWWWVEVPPETCRAVSSINKLCNAASCWIYEYTGILSGIHSILHISRIRVKPPFCIFLYMQVFIHITGSNIAITGQRPDVGYQQGQIPLFSPEVWVWGVIFCWADQPAGHVDLSPLSAIEATNTLCIVTCVIMTWCFSSEGQV
jgi:hypothetical protein